MLASSRMTQKNQITIPANVRQLLGLQRGDTIEYDLNDGEVVLSKASQLDVAFAKAVEATLSEWNSNVDAGAYSGL